MIGSRRKRDMIYQDLLREGFTQAEIDRVHCPIGLKIGGETPEEIGVSIVAELVQVRSARNGRQSKAPPQCCHHKDSAEEGRRKEGKEHVGFTTISSQVK